jgi:Flp pilus assembly protein TadD
MTDQALERARQLYTAGHHEEAEQVAREVLATDPESVPALVVVSRSLVQRDRARDGLHAAREACRIAPQDLDALLALSQAATKAGRRELAIDSARRAVDSSPHDATTHYTLAQALLAGTKDAYPALRAADEAARLAPAWADVHNMRGLCLGDAGREMEARRAFQQALAIDPQHALALSNLASLDIRRNPLDATRKLTRAAGMDPQESVIRHNLATAAHNYVLYLQWVVVAGGLVEGVVVSSGGSRAVRVTVLAVIGLLVVAAAGYFVAQLPRGYRRPVQFIRNLGDAGRARLVILGFVLGICGVIAFADRETSEAMTGRLMFFAVVGGVITWVRTSRSRR